MSIVDHGSSMPAWVCRCSSGLRSASRPAIHIFAGEKVCIHATTPTHAGSELASSIWRWIDAASSSTGFHTTLTAARARRRAGSRSPATATPPGPGSPDRRGPGSRSGTRPRGWGRTSCSCGCSSVAGAGAGGGAAATALRRIAFSRRMVVVARPKWSCRATYCSKSGSYAAARPSSGMYVAAHLAHLLGRGRHVVDALAATAAWIAEPSAGPCSGVDDREREAGDVGVDLHQQRVLGQAAGDDDSTGRPFSPKVSTMTRCEGSRLEQCAVQTSSATGASVCPRTGPESWWSNEDRPVARMPVQCDQPVLADPARGQLGEAAGAGSPAAAAASAYDAGTHVSVNLAEDVADPALADLVAPEPVDASPPSTTPTCPAPRRQHVGAHHVAGGGAHDGDHPAGPDRLGGGSGQWASTFPDRDGDALRQAGPRGGLGGGVAGQVAERADAAGRLVDDEVAEAGRQRG